MEDISEPWQSAHWGIYNDLESHRAWPRNPSPARGFSSWSSATDHDHDWLRRQVVQRRQRDFYGEMEDYPLGEFEAPNRDAHFSHLQSENDRYLAGIDIDDPPQFRSGTPVEEDSFLHWYPSGDATLSYPDTDGQLASINNINIWLIEARSPLLHMAFDHSRNGRPHLHLESLTRMTALPFLRFLYTGSYALTSASGDLYEDVPTSVLLHCQLYRLGDIYDLTELKQQAYLNVLRQCEFGCSSPEKPIDLCAAIHFLYQHLPSHTNVIEAILNYCVTCFLSHRLAHDQDFQQLAYELRPFHQKLCWMATERGQDDAEAASAIIQMPFQPYIPETYASREDHPSNTRLSDVVYHFHSDDPLDHFAKKRKTRMDATRVSNLTMALRSRDGHPDASAHIGVGAESSGSEDEGFSLVKREDPLSTGLQLAGGRGDSSDSEFELLSDVESRRSGDTVASKDMSSSQGGRGAAATVYALPFRTRDAAGAGMAADPSTAVDQGSDSEWSII
ncbi:hypothetical protein KC332_g8828 [Hortaea werneckii]|uniref:BTB domain-containing protein n=2 Tax=Hortaea werneckii TaxID=91943 RepID=A0A3M7IIU5_HORWE|nr:hypothetical protein KC358_g3806 [Hortaea werneckii]OTA27909.1 hypothetical protein BTJ68_12056 [Hortaea werneckii EXF-2000]KAI6848339.1 hypothetical protein KC350_g3052 [Hortaea werneckii]KAI6928137.1 hypothetical protein KC341_g11714 [Hortaea werneckii]KAI6945963.1 hypothetical protein KC348_g3450 [Hortaea werneckii]